jgi:hypothetical protein
MLDDEAVGCSACEFDEPDPEFREKADRSDGWPAVDQLVPKNHIRELTCESE